MDYPDICYTETLDGLPITGVTEVNGEVFVFTAKHTYMLRSDKLSWWRRLLRWLRVRSIR